MGPRIGILLASTSLLGLAAAPAHAHSFTDVITFGTTRTPGLPAAFYGSEKLGGTIDAASWLALRLEGAVTYNFPAPPPTASAKFPTSGATVLFLHVGADFMPNDHFTLSLDAMGSPKSSLVQDSPITVTGANIDRTLDAQARVTSQSIGGMLGLSYDTAGESKAETSADLSLLFNWADTQLEVEQLVTAQGVAVSKEQVLAFCAAHQDDRVNCSKQRLGLLQGASKALGQFVLMGGVTETLYQDTDVGVTGAYYFYTDDPTTTLNSSATLGRQSTGGAARTLNRDFGGGVALSPMQWSVRPELGQRLGPVTLSLWYQYGQYVGGADYDDNMTLGLKIQYRHKFESARLKIWLTGTGQRDVEAGGTATLSGSLALGVRVNL